MTSINSTLLTVGGTPTVFLPLPTSWPSGQGCGENIYSASSDTFLAWDPVFGQRLASSAAACIPPQVTSWWLQSASNLVYTALGPTFVCPGAYSTIATSRMGDSLEEVYCCPSYVAPGGRTPTLKLKRVYPADLARQFSLLKLQPNTAEYYPSQCISLLTQGQTLSYVTSRESDGTIFAVSTTTTVLSSATVFGGPVNGFNLAAASFTGGATTASLSTATSSAAATATATATAPAEGSSSSGALSSGQIIGLSVGIVLGLGLLGAGIFFFFWRRRRQKRSAPPSSVRPQEARRHADEDAHSWQPSQSPKELDAAVFRGYELPGSEVR